MINSILSGGFIRELSSRGTVQGMAEYINDKFNDFSQKLHFEGIIYVDAFSFPRLSSENNIKFNSALAFYGITRELKVKKSKPSIYDTHNSPDIEYWKFKKEKMSDFQPTNPSFSEGPGQKKFILPTAQVGMKQNDENTIDRIFNNIQQCTNSKDIFGYFVELSELFPKANNLIVEIVTKAFQQITPTGMLHYIKSQDYDNLKKSILLVSKKQDNLSIRNVLELGKDHPEFLKNVRSWMETEEAIISFLSNEKLETIINKLFELDNEDLQRGGIYTMLFNHFK